MQLNPCFLSILIIDIYTTSTSYLHKKNKPIIIFMADFMKHGNSFSMEWQYYIEKIFYTGNRAQPYDRIFSEMEE